jgi:hypothetical protein
MSTADACEPPKGGLPNVLEREVVTYWERFGDLERILVALVSGTPKSRFPRKL